MLRDTKCIYCPQTDPARFRGVEHVIPRGFGRFGSRTPTLDCVCDDCNAYFGRELDQLLTRDTYEGISRYSRGQFSSEARPQKRMNLVLADATEAGAFQGLRVSVDGTTGQLMRPAAQFHIHNFTTGKEEVYFLRQVAGLTLPEADYGKPDKEGEPGTWQCKILAASREEHDEMVKALQQVGIDFRPGTDSCPYHKSNPYILMVQSAENGLRLDIAKSLNSTPNGCVLAQGQVSARAVVIVHVREQHVTQMAFAEHHDMINAFPAD
jgi:hypothetical protein